MRTSKWNPGVLQRTWKFLRRCFGFWWIHFLVGSSWWWMHYQMLFYTDFVTNILATTWKGVIFSVLCSMYFCMNSYRSSSEKKPVTPIMRTHKAWLWRNYEMNSFNSWPGSSRVKWLVEPVMMARAIWVLSKCILGETHNGRWAFDLHLVLRLMSKTAKLREKRTKVGVFSMNLWSALI